MLNKLRKKMKTQARLEFPLRVTKGEKTASHNWNISQQFTDFLLKVATKCAVLETLLEEDNNHILIRYSQSVLMHLNCKLYIIILVTIFWTSQFPGK